MTDNKKVPPCRARAARAARVLDCVCIMRRSSTRAAEPRLRARLRTEQLPRNAAVTEPQKQPAGLSEAAHLLINATCSPTISPRRSPARLPASRRRWKRDIFPLFQPFPPPDAAGEEITLRRGGGSLPASEISQPLCFLRLSDPSPSAKSAANSK